MVVHVVLFKPRADLPAQERSAFVTALERAIREIPTVRGVQVGRRLTFGAGYEQTAPDAADFLAVIEFDDEAGLHAYLQHPVHEELGRRFGEIMAAGFVYDFEISHNRRSSLISRLPVPVPCPLFPVPTVAAASVRRPVPASEHDAFAFAFPAARGTLPWTRRP